MKSPDADDDCKMLPPANPTPFPLPSKAPTFWGVGQCQGWGRVGGGGGLDLLLPVRDLEGGTVITPPSTPLPPVPFFFRGGTEGRGVEGGPRSLDLPRPHPHLPTPDSEPTPGVAWTSWCEEVGVEAGTRSRGKILILATPISAPVPTRTALL